MHFTISIIIHTCNQYENWSSVHNRAKFVLNFSFVGLLLQVVLSDTLVLHTVAINKSKNIYNRFY